MTSEKVPSVSIQSRERWYASVASAADTYSPAAAVLLCMVCCPQSAFFGITHCQCLRHRRWSSIPDVGWTVVGLAFVAGASGAAFNQFYTGNIDKETKQKYTALVTFGCVLIVRVGHTLWTSFFSNTQTKALPNNDAIAADTRGEEGSATVARKRRPRRDT
ncbi:TPA: hypothetical protein ACH3X1_006408 [Trebouxia sp. C0004]